MRNRTGKQFSPGAAGPVLAAGREWMDLALCAEIGGDPFFPEDGSSAGPARQVCRRCEVEEECLAYALRHGERYGVWGGKSERDRRRITAARRRESPA